MLLFDLSISSINILSLNHLNKIQLNQGLIIIMDFIFILYTYYIKVIIISDFYFILLNIVTNE